MNYMKQLLLEKTEYILVPNESKLSRYSQLLDWVASFYSDSKFLEQSHHDLRLESYIIKKSNESPLRNQNKINRWLLSI